MTRINYRTYGDTAAYEIAIPTAPDIEENTLFHIELERARWRKENIEITLRAGRFRLCSFQTPIECVELLAKMCFQAAYFTFPPKPEEKDKEL